MRAFLFLLIMLLAPAASAQNFNAQEQAEIRALVRDYLVRNPDVLREALDALESRVAAERRVRIESDRRDFAIGPADAAVTIVEFYDYRCPYCHAAAEWVNDVIRTRRDVRVIFKELPILSPASVEAARAAIAAMPQGRTLAFHNALMAFQGDLTGERIDEIARGAGIDVARMRRAMLDPTTSAQIDALLEENRGLALDIAGERGPATPLFMINGEIIPGFRREELDERVREAAREARTQRQARR
ncbi:MAG: thioredoxin domain-containing protein [Hyphomonadaceae bacterium]